MRRDPVDGVGGRGNDFVPHETGEVVYLPEQECVGIPKGRHMEPGLPYAAFVAEVDAIGLALLDV